jgi:hypothetical protein
MAKLVVTAWKASGDKRYSAENGPELVAAEAKRLLGSRSPAATTAPAAPKPATKAPPSPVASGSSNLGAAPAKLNLTDITSRKLQSADELDELVFGNTKGAPAFFGAGRR